MSGINFMGSYSGIDRNTIDQLLQAESIPLIRMENEKESIQKQQSVWKDVNTRLKNLFDKINSLQDSKLYDSKKATSSSEEYITMSATNGAVSSDYRISIERLATNSNIKGERLDIGKVSDSLGKSGTLTIKNEDGISRDIEIKDGDSLKNIVDKINDSSKNMKDEDGNTIKGTGIKATIIDNRIVLSDEKTGDRNIELSGDIVGDLGLGSATVEKGLTSKFTVNGIEMERDSNNINDAIDGVTINLKKVHDTGKSDLVSVDTDYGKVENAIKEFVDQYNSTMSFIEENIKAGDPDVKNSAGTLSKDSGLKRLQGDLRKLVTSVVNSDKNAINDISQLGVDSDKEGKLTFDSTKFRDAFKEDSEKVIDFFYKEVDGEKKYGLTEMLNTKIDQFISTKNGIIKSKNDSFDKTLKDLNTRMDNFEARIAKKEEYYIKKFTTLDQIMMQAESQMSWLVSQVDSMNVGRK